LLLGPQSGPGRLAEVHQLLTERDANGSTVAAGVDWGATLAKIAVCRPGAAPELRLVPSDDPEALRRALAELGGAARVGVTGGGGERLACDLPGAVAVNEFAAWGAGAAAMLAEERGEDPAQRYLLVSLGTGTSVLLVDGLSVSRVGGTALGGGTLVGLAAGLLGTGEFERIVALARHGSRREVDLLVSDIYRAGGIPLAGDLTAANFGKLAPRLRAGEPVASEDLAHALMGLLGENVALVCSGLAAAAQVRRVVFGGSTLRDNDALVEILGGIIRALGREPVFLRHGEFAGALGALLLAAR
jgi:type II pantothenate kinase